MESVGRSRGHRLLAASLFVVGVSAGPAEPVLGATPSAEEGRASPASAVEQEPREALQPVPEPGPEVERFSEADRDQLGQQRAVVEQMLAAEPGRVPDAELANAFGRLGQIYYAYDLLHPARIAFRNATSLDPDQFGWRYYLAAMHMAEGELEDALRELDRVLELRPGDLPSLVRRGRVLLDLGRIEEAEETFAEALELDPDAAAAHQGIGEVRYEQGRLEDAIARFERALELQPEASSLHYKLGLAHRKAGDMDKAREHLTLNRSGEVIFPDPLIAVLDRFLHGSRSHVKAGNRAMESGDVERAAEHYRQAVEADPEDALAQYNLGFALARLGRPDEAEELFRKAIELDPDYRNAHHNLASTLAQQGRWEEAARHYRRAVEIDPRDHRARLELARTLAATGRRDRALEELDGLLVALPAYEGDLRAEAHVLVGRLVLASGGAEEALSHFRRGVEAAPKHPEPRFGRAMALLLAGRDGEARRVLEGDLDELGRAEGTLPLVHLLARLLATSADPEVRDGERAVELALEVFRARESVDHGETVAMAWAEVGEFQKAINWAREVVVVAERRGGPDAGARARGYLELFQNGRPVREPWEREGGGP